MQNVRFLFFTNERNQAFCDLCLDYFFKHCKNPDVKVSVVSNAYKSDKKKHIDRVQYLESGVDLYNQNRFPLTIEYALSKIEEDYIFLFFDDYFLIRDIKFQELESLMQFIIDEDVDYFGFDELVGAPREFESYQPKKENEISTNIAIKHREYMYLYSLQPCIWKKSSLAKVFERNKNITIHDLDNTKQKIKDSTSEFKVLGSRLHSMFVSHYHYDHIENYFVLAYIEITRAMVFSLPENGFANCPKDPVPQFIYKLIKEENLMEKPEFWHILSLYPLGQKAGVNDSMSASEIFSKVIEYRKNHEN